MIQSNKIFIIGLPRTATTSLSVAMLELGFKTAHTAYTYQCFQQAEVIADTPVFYDYPSLDKIYPNSRFIYLERDLIQWRPSIRQLLKRMSKNLLVANGGFNPVIKRCFTEVFSPFNLTNLESDDFLTACYQKHRSHVLTYFKNRPDDLLILKLADSNSFLQLIEFLKLDDISTAQIQSGFKPINIAGKVTAWNQIKHPLKIESTRNGKIDKIDYQKLTFENGTK
ncbi:sulfotransferase family protein [Catenovulum sp. 2E275]|uniref:sulfotransferase n=1 Tax=Catenovulum sp. 2E275 TaxID=2980497 RepID=UPI0021CF24C9|nr:sulfotransferase [Catenovulum sp. 2E275]MCU4677504.1 sulfotransferase family protein [Catenovulum sp. 2E275]